MSTKIYKEFTFEAAHRLPNVPNDHKCSRLHGHSFRVRIILEGDIDPNSGWLVDFDDIAQAFQPLWKELDHTYLNEVPGLSNPTSEEIARWIWQRLKPVLTPLFEVEVKETCTSGCVYKE